MVRTVCCFLCVLVFSSAEAFALSAEAIEVYKNPQSRELEISVKYPTRQPRNDYIKKIEIYIDGKTPLENNFHFQRGATQNVTIPVADPDDLQFIRVKAYPKTGSPAERVFSAEALREKP